MTPTVLAFVATLIGAFAALWAQNEQSKDSEKLIKAQEEIIQLTKKGLNTVTGGDGYCFVNFYPIPGGKAQVTLISTSEFPLYDIEVRVQRWPPFEDLNLPPVTQPIVEAYKKAINYNEKFYYKITAMSAMVEQKVSSKELGIVPFRAIGTEFYTIDFSARNGEWRQIWEAQRRVNAKDKVSHVIYKKVIKDNKEQTIMLLKSIDPTNPDSFLNDLIMEWKLQ